MKKNLLFVDDLLICLLYFTGNILHVIYFLGGDYMIMVGRDEILSHFESFIPTRRVFSSVLPDEIFPCHPFNPLGETVI